MTFQKKINNVINVKRGRNFKEKGLKTFIKNVSLNLFDFLPKT